MRWFPIRPRSPRSTGSLFTSEMRCLTARGHLGARLRRFDSNATHILNYLLHREYAVRQLLAHAASSSIPTSTGTAAVSPTRRGMRRPLFADEFENRDYRLMQTHPLSGLYAQEQRNVDTPYAPDFGYCVTGYQPIKWVIDDTSMDSNTAPCATSIPILRYAEVLLNYAEAKAELGEFERDGLERHDQTPARTRRGGRRDAFGLRSLHGRILPQHHDRHGHLGDPPRTRHRTAARKLPLGRRHALGHGAVAGNARGTGSMWASWARSTTWTATVRATSASCAKIPR